MLDDHHRGAAVHEGLEHPQQGAHVQGVQADGGLVKHKHRVLLAPAHLAGQLQPLGLPAGQAGGGFPQGQVAQSQVVQHLEPLADQLPVLAGPQGGVDVHGHQLRQGEGCSGPGLDPHPARVPAVPGPPAVRAGDVHVGQELHVQTDGAGAVAGGTAQGAGVVGEVSGLVPQGLGLGAAGVDLPQLVVDVGVGGHGGADIEADGGGVDELHPPDAIRLHRQDVVRQPAPGDVGLQTGDQALQDQGRLPGPGHPGDHGEPPLGDVRLQGLHCVDGPGGQVDAPILEQLFLAASLPYPDLGLSRQEGPDLGGGVRRHVGHRPLGQDPATLRPRLGPHLDEPVGVG